MASPSSQTIAMWTQNYVESMEWALLNEVVLSALRVQLNGMSDDQRVELVEQHLGYIANHLRDERAGMLVDGIIAPFEIDDEEKPYIRRSPASYPELLSKLRKLDPFLFEELCAMVLTSLGAQSRATEKTGDGGVDFLAVNFDFVPDGLPTPNACKAAVIGQAKRYKDGNTISESELRKFVGGALRWRHDLVQQRKINALSPVVYAFWTTSSFEANARSFARAMGLWYMEGTTLAKYCKDLKLEVAIDGLLEKPNSPGKL